MSEDEPTTPEVLHLDRTTRLLIDLMVEHARTEPPHGGMAAPPDADEVLTRRWNEWDRIRMGGEVLVASRLLALAARAGGLK